MKNVKQKQHPCRCEAYRFPHRLGSGRCVPVPEPVYSENGKPWWKIAEEEYGMTNKDFG